MGCNSRDPSNNLSNMSSMGYSPIQARIQSRNATLANQKSYKCTRAQPIHYFPLLQLCSMKDRKPGRNASRRNSKRSSLQYHSVDPQSPLTCARTIPGSYQKVFYGKGLDLQPCK